VVAVDDHPSPFAYSPETQNYHHRTGYLGFGSASDDHTEIHRSNSDSSWEEYGAKVQVEEAWEHYCIDDMGSASVSDVVVVVVVDGGFGVGEGFGLRS
jgi:hypothetical protein